jgi:hypothetical protein
MQAPQGAVKWFLYAWVSTSTACSKQHVQWPQVIVTLIDNWKLLDGVHSVSALACRTIPTHICYVPCGECYDAIDLAVCGNHPCLELYAGATVPGMVHRGAIQHQQQQLQQHRQQPLLGQSEVHPAVQSPCQDSPHQVDVITPLRWQLPSQSIIGNSPCKRCMLFSTMSLCSSKLCFGTSVQAQHRQRPRLP